eukprot:TRINITY_DN820_c1_g2_i2.p1 TRINITY_DN820_c1_g2~~TRINITY_DN820_c1_g2_i2.p1  ORF type:complete len:340 (+),score=85.49 TRINITY_DN820_c1_g2_i2:156-1022(+)
MADLAVLNNRVSAYVLVCSRTLSEVALYLFSLFSVLLTLSSAVSCLDQPVEKFQNIPNAFLGQWDLLLAVFQAKDISAMQTQPLVLFGVYVSLTATVLFLLNLLIAQLSASYNAIHVDMVGYARLKRSQIIIETMPMVSAKRWTFYMESMHLDNPIEFNEGDVGLNGGMQVMEAANIHPTTEDSIRRYGGSTSPSTQWPEADAGDDDTDRFERIETLIKKVNEELLKKSRPKRRNGMSGSNSAGNSGLSGMSGISGGSAMNNAMGSGASGFEDGAEAADGSLSEREDA